MPRTAPADDELDPEFEGLLGFLRDDRGVDFTGYKRASLRRLVARRMSGVGVSSTSAYLDQLQVDPAEVRGLFDSLLINVTSFFRDPTTWESLRTTFLPPLLAAPGPNQPVRVWSAACATGEEAYTLAVLLHEALGDEAFRRRVKVYATDIDEPALAMARAGRFSRTSLEGLSDEQVEAYFPRHGDSHVFRQDLRENLIFGRHDLLSDAPISRVSLLVCRNAWAERMWGLGAFEVEGERLALLPGSVPVEPLMACVRSVLRNGEETVTEQSSSTTVATNRFGQQVLVTLAGSALLDRAGAVRGAILTMDEHSMEQQTESGDDEQTA